MPDELTGGTVVAEAPAQDSGDAQPVPISGETAPAAAAPAGVSVEDFATLSDDELKVKYPQVHDIINRRVDRGISKAQERLKQQYSQEAQEREEANRLVNSYNQLSAEDKLQYRDDPQWGPRITAAQKVAAQGKPASPERERVAHEIAEGLFGLFRAEDPDIDLKDITNPVDGVKKVLETWKGKERKAMEREQKTAIEAAVREQLAKAGIQSDQPERLPGGITSGGHSLSSYLAMSAEGRAAFRRDHADDLDRMTREASGVR